MVKKLTKTEKRDSSISNDRNLMSGWNGEGFESERIASGTPIKFQTDSDAILRFLGEIDISEMCKPAKEKGTALIFKFFDGKRVVSLSGNFASKKVDWKKDYYYYLWQAGEIETSQPQPMKDLVIYRLGVSGQVVGCPDRVSDSKELVLSDENIAPINYERLNYPLR